jgi:hypothetical protein
MTFLICLISAYRENCLSFFHLGKRWIVRYFGIFRFLKIFCIFCKSGFDGMLIVNFRFSLSSLLQNKNRRCVNIREFRYFASFVFWKDFSTSLYILFCTKNAQIEKTIFLYLFCVRFEKVVHSFLNKNRHFFPITGIRYFGVFRLGKPQNDIEIIFVPLQFPRPITGMFVPQCLIFV